MNRFIPLFITSLSILFLLSQCKKDTCNSALGQTFQLIVFDTLSSDDEGNLSLQFEWDTLEELPDTYFADAAVMRSEKDRFGDDWTNDHEDLESWQADGMTFTLLLKASALPEPDMENEIHLHFRFPDRQDHIDCTHGGSGDSYYLDISFELQQNAENEFELSNLTWEETFNAGGY